MYDLFVGAILLCMVCISLILFISGICCYISVVKAEKELYKNLDETLKSLEKGPDSLW
jgi:hypothetical protein